MVGQRGTPKVCGSVTLPSRCLRLDAGLRDCAKGSGLEGDGGGTCRLAIGGLPVALNDRINAILRLTSSCLCGGAGGGQRLYQRW